MEKVSRIVPASTRQIWITGEIEKPKRLADPLPEQLSESAETPNEESLTFKGSRLNMMA